MARTFATDTDPDTGINDITGAVVDGIEALRQRIAQRLRFRRGTWVFAPRDGVPAIIGHDVTVPIASRVVTEAIRVEGGTEIVSIDNVTVNLDPETRIFRYSASVTTIYGADSYAGALL